MSAEPTNSLPTPPAAETSAHTAATAFHAQVHAQERTHHGNHHPNTYKLVLPDIASYVSQGRWEDVTRVCELSDLSTEYDGHISRLIVVAPLVIAYLILDDLPPARFALDRLPNHLNSYPLPNMLNSLMCSVWDRQYGHVYDRTNEIIGMIAAEQSVDPELAVLLRPMLLSFLDAFRRRTFALLARAYTALPVPVASSYLGMSENSVLEVAEESGQWSYDPSQKLLTPIRNTDAKGNGGSSTLATFQSVSRGVAMLEGVL